MEAASASVSEGREAVSAQGGEKNECVSSYVYVTFIHPRTGARRVRWEAGIAGAYELQEGAKNQTWIL